MKIHHPILRQIASAISSHHFNNEHPHVDIKERGMRGKRHCYDVEVGGSSVNGGWSLNLGVEVSVGRKPPTRVELKEFHAIN